MSAGEDLALPHSRPRALSEGPRTPTRSDPASLRSARDLTRGATWSSASSSTGASTPPSDKEDPGPSTVTTSAGSRTRPRTGRAPTPSTRTGTTARLGASSVRSSTPRSGPDAAPTGESATASSRRRTTTASAWTTPTTRTSRRPRSPRGCGVTSFTGAATPSASRASPWAPTSRWRTGPVPSTGTVLDRFATVCTTTI